MKKFQKIKRKNDVEKVFADKDCKVGTKFKHSNGVGRTDTTLQILYSVFRGIDRDDMIIKDLVIQDENNHLHRTLFHYPTYFPYPYTDHGEVITNPIPADVVRDIRIDTIFRKEINW